MSWVEDKRKIVTLYYDCVNKNKIELFYRLNLHSRKSKVIYQIVEFIDERLSAVWFLALHDMLWDADIIERSALESLIKLSFIVYAPDKEEQKRRLQEFWYDLPEINSIKQSEQSKQVRNHYDGDIFQLAHGALVLTEFQERTLRNKWNKKSRQKIEQKWSFSEMLLSLAKNYNGKSFEMLLALAHEYRMCSHTAHGDQLGIEMITERESKPQEQRDSVHRAHLIKLLSDCFAYSVLLSITAMDFIKEDKKFVTEIVSKTEEIMEVCEKYHIEVFNDPDYDKYRKI